MKKQMHCGWFAAALAVLAGGVWATAAGAAAVEGSFARVKALSELVPGDYVVTGSTKGNASGPFAMKNELGGSSTTYIQRHGDDPLPIEGLTDSLVDPDDSLVWTLAEAEGGGWTLHNAAAGVYAAYKSGNSATFADAAVSNAVWTLSEGGTNGLFALENAAKPGRILQYNGTSGSERFACYTNYGNRAQGLAFWRKDASGGGGGGDLHAIAISPYIENGTLSTDPSGTAAAGTWVVVTGIPSDPDAWHLAEVTVMHESSALSYVYTTSGEPIAFEMPGEDVTLSARFEQNATPGPGPGGGAIIFEGDAEGTVGKQVSFTASAALFGATVRLKTFEPPEGSALTEASIEVGLSLVTFVPDVPGDYRFVFATDVLGAESIGEWTVTVLPAEELRITKIEVQGTTVRLEYTGDAASVRGTDDPEAATWTPLASAVLDPTNRTATLPAARKHFLRLSSESAPAPAGVQLWKDGPYWAETNVGADAPEDPGLYFWWGDTLGYRWENDAWTASDGSVTNYSFTWENNVPSDYKDSETLLKEGWTTEAGVLVPEHDAAQAYWGGDWCMPTEADLQALNNNCDWTWTTQNGVRGCIVRGRGDYADNSIFLPAAGYGYLDGLERESLWGLQGYIGSSSPDGDDTHLAWTIVFEEEWLGGVPRMASGTRCFGYPVRPVRAPAE